MADSSESRKPTFRYNSSVSCDNSIYGCDQRFYSFDERLAHKTLCQFEPNLMVKCDDCQREVLRSHLKRHNCIKELSTAINNLKDIVNELETKLNQQLIYTNESKQLLEATLPPVIENSDEQESDPIDSNRSEIDYYCEEEVEEEEEEEDEEEDNQPEQQLQQQQEIFESEPQTVIIEEISHSTSVYSLEPEKSSYIRFNKQISEEVEFSMYGSQKYKYLAQLSRELEGTLPPVDYEALNTLQLDVNKKNKEQLVQVIKDVDQTDHCSSLVRVRSWSERMEQ